MIGRFNSEEAMRTVTTRTMVALLSRVHLDDPSQRPTYGRCILDPDEAETSYPDAVVPLLRPLEKRLQIHIYIRATTDPRSDPASFERATIASDDCLADPLNSARRLR